MKSEIVTDKLNIKFKPDWFEAKYYVYVIKIYKGTAEYFYIGQTGDRKYTAARSPFYRIWGHYNPYNSKSGTDSQLMKNLFLKGLLKDEVNTSRRQIIDNAIRLKEVQIETDFYPIAKFDSEDHKVKRIHTEDVEIALINLMFKKVGQQHLFNDYTKIGQKKAIDEKQKKIAMSIFMDVFGEK